jgi:hypothetical protein
MNPAKSVGRNIPVKAKGRSEIKRNGLLLFFID